MMIRPDLNAVFDTPYPASYLVTYVDCGYCTETEASCVWTRNRGEWLRSGKEGSVDISHLRFWSEEEYT